MKNYEEIASDFCAPYADAKNYKVLEVGSDSRGGMLTSMAPLVDEIVGINIIGNPEPAAKNATFQRGDIRRTSFEDNTFDLVISYAVFEHVGGIKEALDEIHRILKPGGELHTKFGPVWSCMWGHHLWVVQPETQNYIKPPFLPPWCHLLMEPNELRAVLDAEGCDAKHADNIVRFVYESNEQNRVFHDGYTEMVNDSDFKIVEFTSNRNAALEGLYLENAQPMDRYIEELEKKYGPGDYMAASLSLRLQK